MKESNGDQGFEPEGNPQGPVPPPEPRARTGPWRWVLGAVSIAALGAGIFFISKKGVVGKTKPSSGG